MAVLDVHGKARRVVDERTGLVVIDTLTRGSRYNAELLHGDRSRLQVTQELIKVLLVCRRLLPLPEIANVALVPQFYRPRFASGYHRVVDADRK